MAIENFNEDVEVIQKLDTLPNQEGGLSAEELKAKFDQAAIAIKNFINNSLLPVVRELEDAKDPSIIYGLDQTLSELGRAADAKAVGDALAGKVGTKDIIGIACGGTGADNAEAARRNLDAAQAEHTHSASDMKTGLLPLERGGTGAGTAAQAMENLGITAALAGKAPLALGAPHNYLDNSDFRDPVNQRGKTSYAGTGGYAIDMWKLQLSTNMDVNDGYITLSGLYDIKQMNSFPVKAGQVYTLAVRVKALEVPQALRLDCFGSGEAQLTIMNDGWQTFVKSGAAPSDFAVGEAVAAFIGLGASNKSIQIEWAALYEGDYTAETLPDYKPKGYGAELAECQRYFQMFKAGQAVADAFAYNSTNGNAQISTPVTMRIRPSVSYSGLKLTDSLRSLVVAGLSVTNNSANCVSVAVTVASGLTAQKHETLACSDTGYLRLSAEL